jgi:hypothetical protein
MLVEFLIRGIAKAEDDLSAKVQTQNHPLRVPMGSRASICLHVHESPTFIENIGPS